MSEEPNMRFMDWAAKARQASIIMWGYEELINDDPESAMQSWLHGEDPAEYVKQLGEELDLIKATKYWMGRYGI